VQTVRSNSFVGTRLLNGEVHAAGRESNHGRGGSAPIRSVLEALLRWESTSQVVRGETAVRNCSPSGKIAVGSRTTRRLCPGTHFQQRWPEVGFGEIAIILPQARFWPASPA
jgi:hypothetical protein